MSMRDGGMAKDMVSVIVPIYNGALHVENCVKFLEQQTYRNVEVILIDDGSTDVTGEKCEELAKGRENFRVIHIANKGVSAARNLGMNEARGKYLMFMDVDDEVSEKWVERMVKNVQRKGVKMARCVVRYQRPNGKDVDEKIANELYDKKNWQEMVKRLVTRQENVPAYLTALIMEKDVYVRCDEKLRYMEDLDFLVRAVAETKGIYLFDEVLYIYKYNAESTSKNPEMAERNIYDMVSTMQKVKRFLSKQKIMTGELEKKIDANVVGLIFTKLNLVATLKRGEAKKMMRRILEKEGVWQILENAEMDELSKYEKMKLKLVKEEKWGMLRTVFWLSEMKGRM